MDKPQEIPQRYVVVLSHPDGMQEAVAWTDELDRAEDCAVGIVTGIVAESKYPPPGAQHDAFEWTGGAGVYEVGKDWNAGEELMGVDAEDVQDLAKPGLWNP